MELCSCSVRDIFDYTEDPLLEKEIALIARQSLEVNFSIDTSISHHHHYHNNNNNNNNANNDNI